LGARIIAAASTEEKRQFAIKFGADAALDYTLDGWRNKLNELTGGHGADVIYDPVGGGLSVRHSSRLRGMEGTRGRLASGVVQSLRFLPEGGRC
jgi:NADPH2:quinone reductase